MRQLKQVDTGRIFGYTEALAKRKDMIVIGEAPVQKGLSIQTQDDSGYKAQIKSLQEQLDALMADNQALLEEIAKLKGADPDRFKKICDAAEVLITTNDSTAITSQGKIRIERLEAVSGIADITSQERDAAMEAMKKAA